MTEDFTGDEVTAMSTQRTDYKALIEVARARYKLACDEMDRLTAEGPARAWRWSIPANPDRDSDLILSASSEDVPKLADAVEALVAENENIRASHERSADHLADAAHNALTATMKERDDAVRELAESRARLADSEARRVELEAVIEKVSEWASETALIFYDPLWGVLSAAPSTVLGEHDQEVAARALEAFAGELREAYPSDVFPKPTNENYHDLNVALARTNITLDRFSADLMRRGANLASERAAAIRKGEHA